MNLKKKVILNLILVLMILLAILMILGIKGNFNSSIRQIQDLGVRTSKLKCYDIRI